MFSIQLQPQAAADDGGSVSLNRKTEYLSLSADAVRKEADDLFVKAYDSTSAEEREKYYGLSLAKYYVLS